ncbi:FBP1-like protein, partial [Mya arenaria]
IGTLNVYLQSVNGTHIPGKRVWSSRGNHGPVWRSAKVQIIPHSDLKIVFEGSVGDGYVGDIALDDISFADGSCAPKPTTAPVTTTPVTTSISTTSSGTYQDECSSSPCKNGATCEDDVDNFVCNCKHGYAGILCETVLDPCFSNPCVNGKCFSHHSLFLCICPAHLTGKYCEMSQDICASMPCLNGATCSSHEDTLTCSCSEGFDGTRCEHGHGLRSDRGPLCLDCDDMENMALCKNIAPCAKDECPGVASADGFCKSCCDQDMCNTNCTRPAAVAIVG